MITIKSVLSFANTRDTDIFSSDILEASDDSDKDKTCNPPVTGNNQSDTDPDSEYGKSGHS